MSRVVRGALCALVALGPMAGRAEAVQVTQQDGRAPWQTPALSQMPLPEWLSLSGEVRTRMESRTGLGYQDSVSDRYGLVRTRLNVGITPHGYVHFFVQGQDARAPGILPARASGVFRDPFDLRQAYVRLGPADGVASLTVGRQLLLYGDQRLIGPLDWTNTSRSFDAATLSISIEWADVDVFSGRVVQNDPTRSLNKSHPGNGLHGIYASVNTGTAAVSFEPFALWRTTPSTGAGEGDRYSGGVRLAGTVGGLQSSVMLVEQWGTVGGLDVSARALSLSAGYGFDAPLAPRVYAEYNYASGDGDPTDGELGSFDDMFPTAHLYYGYNDLVGLRNVRNLRVGISVTPLPRLTLSGDFHTFSLADGNDGLYNVAGAPTVAAPAGGAADLAVGEEVDVTARLRLSETVGLSGGFGYFFPGAFVEANSPGAANTFTHVALAVRF